MASKSKTAPEQHACPNCGYCPHCGRSNTPIRPAPYWVRPYWEVPYGPPRIGEYRVTYGANSTPLPDHARNYC